MLVLATGNTWSGPIEIPTEETALKEHLATWRARIEKAKSVLFVGGGIVSAEWAAEILDFHKVSVICRARGLSTQIDQVSLV
mgnify:FL=1